MTRAKAQELYELRAVLEGFAVRLAVERGRLGHDQWPVLEDLLDKLEAAGVSGDPLARIEAERALHRAVWSRCDNGQLLDYLAQVQVQTRRLLLYNKAFSGDPASEIRTHRALIEEVLSGDAHRSEAAVRNHVQESARLVLARLPESDEAGSRLPLPPHELRDSP